MTGTCDSPAVQLLPGTSELTPNNPWGGVLVDDINIRYLNLSCPFWQLL